MDGKFSHIKQNGGILLLLLGMLVTYGAACVAYQGLFGAAGLFLFNLVVIALCVRFMLADGCIAPAKLNRELLATCLALLYGIVLGAALTFAGKAVAGGVALFIAGHFLWYWMKRDRVRRNA